MIISLILIGLVGGILTSLSPCILPVLPLILAVSGGQKRRPYLVVGGLATSFALLTLLGSVVLNALGLPQSTLRWIGIGMLVAVGIGMLIPAVGALLQAPFDKLPKPYFLQNKARDKGGFAVGLALGTVYVPCAGPVLAAITVAAATGKVDASIVALTISFALGAALPLLLFALGGHKVGQRVDWFQSHNTTARRISGVVVIALATALAFDAPAAIQRAVPDWTAQLQHSLGAQVPTNTTVEGRKGIEHCRTLGVGTQPNDCGELPKFEGLTNWINTDTAVDPASNGKVTLVDFWAYACINCQRANTHITKMYDTYKDYGLEVVGIHAPEYGFERDLGNLKAAVDKQKIHYPVAQDNDFATWENFNNRYWPARYLADHTGTLVQLHEGEGNYAETETLIRTLLTQRDPAITLPNPVEQEVNTRAHEARSPETYLGAQRSKYQNNPARGKVTGEIDFGVGRAPKLGFYTLAGTWNISADSIAARSENASIELNYKAKWVQLVISGTGQITLTRENGDEQIFEVTEDGTIDIIKEEHSREELITLTPSEGLELYSFTFG
ncbi:cytochrome c biogenesis protein CcdA [Corynebacterium felinum]|uniref:Cytochrome c biogenesis protein CcdA/thiol-disulfide isomerase/thioredoxin n=1 Tax=Corynebacterium felinum TaxID=131318 RepID=A0ABU2B880_9CORY|nr:cytochrome c biogenesis protein CcdA [Corynebacterium felinum]MDF5819672.1 cytochrome c biogenesis protein CcdA [Corynebacterium felinum]MDR7353599.1 cytochrome c biogenesis protein CcdA/thiol-disulfide isomerase/thioredoxin [Corynebacterium felinum]WJY95779.1 Thiol-disulfide oxidoreductase YkuV [Corynebacterium felinum]